VHLYLPRKKAVPFSSAGNHLPLPFTLMGGMKRIKLVDMIFLILHSQTGNKPLHFTGLI